MPQSCLTSIPVSHMYTFNKQNNVIKNSKGDYYKSILGCFISGVHFVWHGHSLRPTVNGSYLKASGGLGSSGQEPDVTESVNADTVCTGEQCSFLLPNIYSLRLLCRPTETGPYLHCAALAERLWPMSAYLVFSPSLTSQTGFQDTASKKHLLCGYEDLSLDPRTHRKV